MGRARASPTAYTGLLRAAGFEQVAFEDLTTAVTRTWVICVRRLSGRLMSHKQYVHYLLSRRSTERAFLPAMLRILAAYRVGAMRYGLLVARNPP